MNNGEGKSLANEASEPDQNHDNRDLRAKRKELGEKLIEIMIAKNPEGRDCFADQEKQSVKDTLKKTGHQPQEIEALEGAIDEWEQILKERQAEFEAVPF